MADVPGHDIKVLINSTQLARLKTKGMTINNEPVDGTTDDEHPWRALVTAASIKSVEITCSGLVSDHATLGTLKSLAMNASDQTATMTFQNGSGTATEEVEGTFQITSFEENGSTDGLGEFTATFMSSKTVTVQAI